MIRVGRCEYNGGKYILPEFEGFTPIVVMLKSSSKWYPLSPYYLNDNGMIMENIWQFSKVYEVVPKGTRYQSRFSKKIIWDHPEEVHVKDGELTKEYFAWREKGFHAEDPIRYPVGFNHRHKCLYAYYDGEKLDYVESRKKIYKKVYTDLVVKEKKFLELKQKLKKENLLIIEIDGPRQESLNYYIDKYDVDDDFIKNKTMLATKENLDIMLNDPKYPFGHGYCLASALLDPN